jgi:hypothetical protein
MIRLSALFLVTASLVLAARPALAASPVINEFVANHIGTDDHEFVEIFGDPGTDYSGLTILQIEGDASGAGVIDGAYPVGTTDAAGFWMTGYLNNMIENGTMTLLLVEGFSGAVGSDLDTNNDGVFDSSPFTATLDEVAVSDAGAGDHTYGTTTLPPTLDGGSFTPGGASRIPNGTDTDAVADWDRNDFDGQGLPGFTGTPATGEAINTPGTSNHDFVPPADPVINEFVANHVGADDHEFIELFGLPNTDYSHLKVIAIEGDGASAGIIDAIFNVGTTDAAGFWTTGFLALDALENGSNTFVLGEGFFGSVGQDLDTNNDGTLDINPFSRTADAVGVTDGGASDHVYTAVSLAPGYDGNASTVGGASRLPNGTDTNAVADWVRNDFDGAGFSGFVGTPALGEALNTPGSANMTALDLIAPVITVDLDRTVLWPPNHRLAEVCATIVVTDDRDPSPTFVLTSITSNEPDDGLGDGHTTRDVRDAVPGTADLCFSLRAERSGGGDGREYTIVYTATDAAGNTSTGSAIVRVPHDESGQALFAAGFNADGTSFASSAGGFALVIPSIPATSSPGFDGEASINMEGLDATQIDPHLVYMGNIKGTLRPDQSSVRDVNGDGFGDLLLFYSSIDEALRLDPGHTGTSGDGTLALHFEGPDGTQYFVESIFGLAAVSLTAVSDPGLSGAPTAGSRTPVAAADLSIQPNPFNPTTTIMVDVASPARVSLRIFDVRGALVKTLKDENLPAGRNQIHWDGRDDHGHAVASGIYFVHYESMGVNMTRRAVLLK